MKRKANWVYEIVNSNLTSKIEIDPFYFDTNPKAFWRYPFQASLVTVFESNRGNLRERYIYTVKVV